MEGETLVNALIKFTFVYKSTSTALLALDTTTLPIGYTALEGNLVLLIIFKLMDNG